MTNAFPRRCAVAATILTALLLCRWGTSPVEQKQAVVSQKAIVPIQKEVAKATRSLLEAAEQAQPVAEQVSLAKQRAAWMLTLLQTAPAVALEHSVTSEQRAELPAEVAEHVEQSFSTLAAWKLLPNCGGGRKPSAELVIGEESLAVVPHDRWLTTQSKNGICATGIKLQGWAALSPSILTKTGDKLTAGGKSYAMSTEVSMEAVEEVLREADSLPGPENSSGRWLAAFSLDKNFVSNVRRASTQAASSWTETPKRVLLIPVDFSDRVGSPVNLGTLFSTMTGSVAGGVAGMSYGRTSITTTVFGLVRMPAPTTTYLPSKNNALHSAAKTAATAAGAVLSNFDIIGVVFADINITSGGSSYAGLATIGGSELWLQETTDESVLLHELGHNYGLEHASFWQTTDGSVVGTGTNAEYGDDFDIMGSGELPAGHMHVQAKRLLNWIPAADAPIVTTSGTHRLLRIDNSAVTTGKRGVNVAKSGGGSYWLCFRGGESQTTLDKGLALYWEQAGTDRSWLLDATPLTTSKDGLTLGRTYSDTASQLHITPRAIGGTGNGEYMDVEINLGAFPGNLAPTGTISGPTSTTARTSVLFTANFTDPEGFPLSYSWDFGDGTVYPDDPVISKFWNIGGTYTVSVTASDRRGRTITQSLNVTVTDPASTWTARTSGTTGDLLDIAPSTNLLVAVGGNSVTHPIVLTSPNGTTWTSRAVPTPLNVYLRAVVWTGTQFVAAGQDYDFAATAWKGVIYTSPDGITWTRAYFGAMPLNDLAFGNNSIVAVGETGSIVTSTGGGAWTVRNSGTTEHELNSVAFQSPNFVVVGYDSAGSGTTVCLRSSTLSTWTNLTTSIPLTDEWRDFRSIANLNQTLFAGGFYGGLYRTTDAASSWAAVRAEDLELSGWAYGNGVYLASGISYSPSQVDVDFYSTVGNTATPWTQANPGALQDRNAATFYNNTFVTVGQAGSIRQSAAFTTPSGFPFWQASTFPAGATNNGPTVDADGDGFNNLWEYAAGTNPLVATSKPVIATSTTGGSVTLGMASVARPADVVLTAETSTTLASWTPTGFTQITNTPTQYTVSLPVTTSGKKFIRLRLVTGAQ